MSEMITPPKFIAATALVLFGVTIVSTIETGSLVVFVIGMALTLGLPRAMIGIGRT